MDFQTAKYFSEEKSLWDLELNVNYCGLVEAYYRVEEEEKEVSVFGGENLHLVICSCTCSQNKITWQWYKIVDWGAESKGRGAKSKIKTWYCKEIALNTIALKSTVFGENIFS